MRFSRSVCRGSGIVPRARAVCGACWRILAVTAFAFLATTPRASVFTWDGGGGDDNWSSDLNWAGDVAPPAVSLTHEFHFAGIVRLTPVAQSPYSVNSLTFDAGAGAFTLSGGMLTVGAGGLTQNSANTQTINNAIVLASAQTWTLASGAGALNLGSTATVDTGGFALAFNGATGTNANLAGAISGSGGLTKAGAGTLTLSGTNTYSGSTVVTNGTLTVAPTGSLIGSDISVGTGAILNINGSIDTSGKNFVLDGAPASAPLATLTTGGSLAAGYTYVGLNGSGNFVQSGGNHSVSAALYLGMNAGSNGTYNLSGGTLSSPGAIVGVYGTGNFTQTAGTHTIGNSFLYIGYGAGSNGTYNLSGGTFSSYTTIVGYDGAGTFTQSGGDALVDSGLYLGFNAGSSGTYNLSAGTLSTTLAYIGLDGTGNFNLSGTGAIYNGGTVIGLGSGTGTFTQTGGTHTINSGFYLGYDVGSTGNYTLNSGTLSTDSTFVGTSGNATFTQNGGTHADRIQLVLGYSAGSTGTYNLNAGSLAPGDAYVGYFGSGNFNQAGGSVATNGLYLGAVAGGDGTYTLSNGDLTTNLTYVGSYGTGTFTQTGGAHTVSAGGNVTLGFAPGTSGTYNLSGGTLTTPSLYVGNSGPGTFTQTGGTANSNFVILGTTAGISGTYNLNGGILNTGSISRVAGNATFNFNGGTLQANQSTPALMSGLTVANVKTGGANIDTNGFNVTIAQPLLHDTTGGAPPTDGGLTKFGTGTLTLAGANTYRGTTTINAGTLAITGSLNGATGTALTFGGSGTVNFNEAAGSTQNMGTLTFGAGDGTVQSTYGGSGNTSLIFTSLAALPVGATGNFVVSGGTNGTTNKIVLSGQAAGFIDAGIFYGGNEYAWYDASGYVRAVNYGVDPGTSFSSGGATLIGDHVKTNGTISDQGTERIETLHIDGNITITMGSNKKLTTNSILKTGNVAGTATITSGRSIESDFNTSLFVRTNGVNDALNIVTPIEANGTNGLTKAGAGALTLSGNNTYTGETNVREGTLLTGANERLFNTGALTVSGGTFNLQNFNETVGAVTLMNGSITGGTGTLTGSSYTMQNGSASAILAGTAALTKTTSGTVTLTRVNTYSGGSTINAGTLVVNNAASLGANSGGLNLNAGTLEIASGFSSSRNITLGDATSTFLVDPAQTYTVTSGIIGTGTLNKTGTGTMVLSGNNTFSGGSKVFAGTLQISANERLLNSGSLTVSGGTFDVQTFSETLGPVLLASGAINGTGTGTLTGSSYEVQSGSVSAILAGAGSLLKTTNGTVTFTGANTYIGGTNVMAGTLRMGGNERLANTGGLTVSGGTFDVQTFGETVGAVVLSSGVIDGTGAGTLTGSSFNVQSGLANAILAGNVLLTKTTSGTVTLAGANTYSGGTDVRAGVLQTNANERLLNSGTLTVSGGTFNVQAFGETVGAVVLKSGAINGTGTGTVIGSSFDVQSGSASAILAGSAAMTKTTNGTVTLTGANTFSGSTTINAGTLIAAATSGEALANTPTITINTSGNLLLGASDQVNNIASMTLAGGTFSKGNFSEGSATGPGLGSLNLTAPGGTIDFGLGTVGVLTFSTFNPGANSLLIDNWTGTVNTVGDLTTDRLIFQSDQTANLSNFLFTNYQGATQFALGGGFYEVTPFLPGVPEINPAFAASIFCALLAIFTHARSVRAKARLRARR